jgi:serine phosphatase RsbU (regulator of sigma subunit)
VNYVNRTKQELVIEDVTREGKLKDSYIRKNKPKSVLCIPLLSKGKIVGIVYLENNITSGAFTKDRIEVIKILSSQAAISIENASLYSNLENITKEKTRVTTEMEIAKDIQTSLLPTTPTLSGFDVATYMLTADLVGGDYFDIIDTEGREWFVIGDVSGHGVTAGLIMMMTQTAIHTILNSMETKNPALLLSKVNQIITSNIHKMKLKKYMTLTLFLKEADGTIYYSGMHQDLLLYVAKKKTVETIETNGSWIGYYDLHNEFQVDHINMESGDVLLLFTDGITESINADGSMYEIDGLVKILNEYGEKSVEEIKQRILNSLKDFKTDDDTTFMICKRK